MFNKCGSSILEGKGNKGISNKNPFHVYMAQVALLFDNTRQSLKLFESVKIFFWNHECLHLKLFSTARK